MIISKISECLTQQKPWSIRGPLDDRQELRGSRAVKYAMVDGQGQGGHLTHLDVVILTHHHAQPVGVVDDRDDQPLLDRGSNANVGRFEIGEGRALCDHAAISPWNPRISGASWTTSSRPVFFTEAMSVGATCGDRADGSGILTDAQVHGAVDFAQRILIRSVSSKRWDSGMW
jgi:hypothetical protein